jgi:hypothetical protein
LGRIARHGTVTDSFFAGIRRPEPEQRQGHVGGTSKEQNQNKEEQKKKKKEEKKVEKPNPGGSGKRLPAQHSKNRQGPIQGKHNLGDHNPCHSRS